MHLCVGCEAADYPHKALNFDKVHCVKAHPCKGVLGIHTNNLGPLRVHMLAIHILVNAQINCICS